MEKVTERDVVGMLEKVGVADKESLYNIRIKIVEGMEVHQSGQS